jgi:hypothetical protein
LGRGDTDRNSLRLVLYTAYQHGVPIPTNRCWCYYPPLDVQQWLCPTETLWEMKFECFPYVHTVDQHDE